ncbi:uncharacterized protein CLUP02_12833 [Colletotrichum lupini]|uniref:Uncharacterized protein n=2 Tax=Colletotrichum acutatum species complex TaxID=2707335 RepID=A0A9Q8T152_9PEZI|nr:uncharacterized protein CLUP02_12833 [Colletotrichum lupini]XP_060310117.1 uncharacterized protein CCOS01_11232 [Colletotrichum costaricense]KAK1519581.1 hypothetical protein CCOS01_11232 [Colletotrichum costaricense]UQC87329.1 hypothetical protein CLUP02_12833 [Colletotrichum lupini]
MGPNWEERRTDTSTSTSTESALSLFYGPLTPASADLETVAPPKASPPFSHRQDLEHVDSAEDAEGRLPPTKGRNSHGLSGATRRTGSTRVLGRIWTQWARISNPATTMNGQAFRLHSVPQPSSLFMFDRQSRTRTQKWPEKPDKFKPNRPEKNLPSITATQQQQTIERRHE